MALHLRGPYCRLLPALLALLLLCALPAHAQYESNIWYFGDHLGLDFSNANPRLLTNGAMYQAEGCASVCDSATGALLFYTDGTRIWDASHNQMEGGDGLLGHFSSAQSALIIPAPFGRRKYLVFTANVEGTSAEATWGANYVVVDMERNGGLGALVARGQRLMRGVSEQLTAVRHCDGKAFWVIYHSVAGNAFYSFYVDSNGVFPVATPSYAGTFHPNPPPYRRAYLKASPDGRHLALVSREAKWVELFDFDPQTGIVSGGLRVSPSLSDTSLLGYGASFSPDSRRLYFALGHLLYQVSVDAGSDSAIVGSRILLNDTANWSRLRRFFAMQLGRDGRLYLIAGDVFSGGVSTWLSAIDRPDQAGPGCGFRPTAFILPGRRLQIGLPNVVDAIRPSCPAPPDPPGRDSVKARFELSDDTLCVGGCLAVSDGSLGPVSSREWRFDGGTPPDARGAPPQRICYAAGGRFPVRLIVTGPVNRDTAVGWVVVRDCAPGRLSLEPPLMLIDSVPLGFCHDTLLTIRNVGEDLLSIPVPRIEGGSGMTSVEDPVRTIELAGGESYRLQLRYCPADTGCVTFRVIATSNRNADTTEVRVCAAPPRPRFSADTIDLGVVPIGSCVDTTLTLRNDGRGVLRGILSLAGATGFQMSHRNGDSLRLYPTEELPVRLQWCPVDTGCYQGVVSLRSVLGIRSVYVRACGVGPRLTLQPREIDFGAVVAGSCRDTAITLGNSGNAPLQIQSALFTGGPLSIVSWSSTSRTIPPGGSLSVLIRYCPTGPDSLQQEFYATTNSAGGSVGVVPLRGVGLQGRLVVAPGRFDFGSVPVGSCRDSSIILRNVGTAPFRLVALPSLGSSFRLDTTGLLLPRTIGVGEELTVRLSFCPGQRGPVTDELRVKGLTVVLAGTGVEGKAGVSRSRLDFGDVEVGRCATDSFTLRNVGNLTILLQKGGIVPPSGGGSSFSIRKPASWPQSLAAGASLTVVVEFCPTQRGNDSATARLESDDSIDVSLHGRGVVRDVAFDERAIDAGCVSVGDAVSRPFTIENRGDSAIVVRRFAVDPPSLGFFAPWLADLRIPPGGRHIDSVRFVPRATGTVTASLIAIVGDDEIPLPLTGRGGRDSALRASPSTLSFGGVAVGSTVERCLLLENIGCAPQRLDSVRVASGSVILSSGSFPMMIGAGEQRTICFRFLPRDTGSVSGSVELIGERGGFVPFDGRGLARGIALAPDSIDFGDVPVGSATAPRRVVVTAWGDGPSTLRSLALVGANAAEFAETHGWSGDRTLAVGESLEVDVTVRPAAAGTRSARLILTDAEGREWSVALRAVGLQKGIAGSESLDAGGVTLGRSRSIAAAVTVANNGAGAITIDEITLVGDDAAAFAIAGIRTGTIGVGEVRTGTLHFTPTHGGMHRAEWRCRTSDGDLLLRHLSGEGLLPELLLRFDTVRGLVGDPLELHGRLEARDSAGAVPPFDPGNWHLELDLDPRSLFVQAVSGPSVSHRYDHDGTLSIDGSGIADPLVTITLEGLAGGRPVNEVERPIMLGDSTPEGIAVAGGLILLDGCDIGKGGGVGALRILSVGPQPAGDRLRVRVASELQGLPIDVALYDLTGRRLAPVEQGRAIAGGEATLEIDFSGVRSGTYLLELRQGDARSRAIVLVER